MTEKQRELAAGFIYNLAVGFIVALLVGPLVSPGPSPYLKYLAQGLGIGAILAFSAHRMARRL